MDKVQKIREEVERLKSQLLKGACSSQVAMETLCKEEAYNEVLGLLDTMQEEPKECMYSKDNYTDEDRKALCGSCEAECIDKINEERKRDLSLWSLGDFENNFFEIINPYKDSHNYKNLCIRLVVWRRELWRWIHWKKRKEEPVSEDLEEAATSFARKDSEGISNPANFYYTVADKARIFKAGTQWQKEQFEKNRLKHCNSITNEQAELEQGFIDQHLDKYQRMPTFLDAIEYGMSLKEKEMQSTIELAEDHAMLAGMEKMKEQMLANAVDAVVKIDAGGYPYIDRTIELYDYDKDTPLAKEGDKYKVILIKGTEL